MSSASNEAMKVHGADHSQPMVEMRSVYKYFPGVVANADVDLKLYAGEVHALLGENGAGKSTLMKILTGLYQADAGTLFINGRETQFRSPAQAIAAGIGMVHQHFRLVEKMTVAENIHFGWKETPRRVSNKLLAQRTEKICKEFGLHVDPEAKIWQLSVGEQQRVEILRVLARGAEVLILDEPTSVLTPNETRELYRVVKELTAIGRTVVLITHKLDEVLEAADTITVLRGGRKVATVPAGETNSVSLAALTIGQDVECHTRCEPQEHGKGVLELRGVRAFNDRRLPALKDVNLTIHEGEIVGIAGVAGNGQTELAEVITGLRELHSGQVIIDGVDLSNATPKSLTDAGVGHIPEDRLGVGLVRSASVAENAILREYHQTPINSGYRINKHEMTRFAEDLVKNSNVKTPNVRIPVCNLSGGNQQKLVLGRETKIASRLLVAVHPTVGLDVGAMEAIRQVLSEQRKAGVAILLISEDLDEILIMSDRIAVMYGGAIVGEFEADCADRETIGLLMGGSVNPQPKDV